MAVPAQPEVAVATVAAFAAAASEPQAFSAISELRQAAKLRGHACPRSHASGAVVELAPARSAQLARQPAQPVLRPLRTRVRLQALGVGSGSGAVRPTSAVGDASCMAGAGLRRRQREGAAAHRPLPRQVSGSGAAASWAGLLHAARRPNDGGTTIASRLAFRSAGSLRCNHRIRAATNREARSLACALVLAEGG